MAERHLELEVLATVRRLGVGGIGDIYRAVKARREVAYSTVATVIYRLVKKGQLEEAGGGKRSRKYSAAAAAYREERLSAVTRVLEVFGPDVASHLIGGIEVHSPKESEAIRKRLKRLGVK